MSCLHWFPKPAAIATMRLYIPSFLFEHFSLVSKPADGLFSSSALLVQSSVVTYLNIICWNKSSLALAVFSF